MSETPFRDTATRIAEHSDYVAMQVNSDNARSHAWWRKLVEYGAWGSSGIGGRVGPPTPEAIPGIAQLFGTTEERVAAMIAADWYDVHPDTETSARVLSLGPLLDKLDEDDAALAGQLLQRLCADYS